MSTSPDLSVITERILAVRPDGYRALIAVAGAPASGKSTFAAQLVSALEAAGHNAAVVPMDGFHLDNGILQARGLLPRKGAPETFDASGFIHLIQRLGTEPEVIIPLFDRARDIAIAGAARVEPQHRILIVEGNYLLFDESPWSLLRSCWDLAIRLDVPLALLEQRLVQRWRNQGLDEAGALRRAQQNDIPNARRIQDRALPADLVLQNLADQALLR